MRSIKLIIIALILALTGIIYAAGQQTPTDNKDKAASCCAKCNDSCCTKAKDTAQSSAHKSCDMSKDGKGCCDASKADCCKAGAECCKDGADCCKADASSCCAHNHMSRDKQGKAEACDMKDGKGCCGADCDCCKSGSCDMKKMSKQ